MRLSWEIKSVDALFCNGMTRVGDLSREAILSSIREDQDLSILKDDINKNLFNDKKFCKECISACVIDTQRMDFIEELIDFLIGMTFDGVVGYFNLSKRNLKCFRCLGRD